LDSVVLELLDSLLLEPLDSLLVLRLTCPEGDL